MKRIIIILAGIVMSANIFAQEQDTVYTGTLYKATPTDMAFGDNSPCNDVFYKFTPIENTKVSIELNYTGSNKDIYLYSNLPNALVSSFGTSGLSKTITRDVLANVTYYIRVVECEQINEMGGDFTLKLKDITPFDVVVNGSNGVVSGADTYLRNSECTVSAVPADCYRFVNWTENGNEVSDDIEYTFLVENNRVLRANFELRKYEIYSSSENGTITPTQIVFCGDNSQPFTFFPVDSCHEFDGLWVDGEQAVAQNNNTSYTFSNVKEGFTIFAAFKKKHYALISSNSVYGYITPSGTRDVFCGDTLTYTFTSQTLPNTESELNYIVVDDTIIYAGDSRIVNNSYTFENITEPHTIYAAFKRITFNVSAIADAHSTISGNTEVIKGENCTLLVNVTDACYEIDSVFINGVYEQNTTYLVKYTGEYTSPPVTADFSIRVSTKQKEYKLTVFYNQYGVVKQNGNTVNFGDDIQYLCGAGYLDFVPNANCEVAQVLLDNDTITYLINNNRLDLSLITGNHSLTVIFKKSPLKLFLFAHGNGKIVFDGCDNNCNMLEVEYNSSPQICFLPDNNNFKIAYIVINYNDTVMASNFTNDCYTLPPVTANHRIDAYFVPSTTYFITATASANGQIDPHGYAIPVEKGENIEFCFYPEDGYIVEYVKIDNAIVFVGDTTCYTIENVIKNYEIYVSFSQKTGIENIEESFIKIYPNPVDNLLVIESSELKTGDKIDIFDMSGKLALSLTINESNKASINVSGLSQGTYIFKIGHIQGKFVKK